MGFTATPRKARALVPLFCAWINSFLATGEVAVVVEEVAARAGRPRVKYWLLGPFKVWTGLRERRRAAETLRRRRRGGGAFVSLDRITGTTPTVGTLSRTVRTGPTRSWKMSAAKTCRQARGDAAWKLAVRAAPIVKPPCFYSMRRLPGTIKMSGLSCFCFVRGSILFYARGSGQTRQLLIREEK